jgi:hypothetical protein
MKAKYFIRCMRFESMDEHIVLIDPKSPRVVTLDPWLEVIYAAADGQSTIQEFIERLKTQYSGGAPTGLEQQTIALISKMEAEGVIRLVQQPTQLPYYLSIPVAKQDKERALTEMKKDGYVT